MKRPAATLGALSAAIAVALSLGSGASASAAGAWNWTSYDLSAITGVAGASGNAVAYRDAQTGGQDVFTNTTSGSLILFTTNGAGAATAFDVTTQSGSGPGSTSSPTVVTDPADNDPLLYSNSASPGNFTDVLIQYDRTSTANTWPVYSVSSGANNQEIAGTPSAIAPGGVVTVLANTPSANHLYAFTRSGSSWTGTDVSSATSHTIVNDPVALTDPDGTYASAYAEDSSGHLVAFADANGAWSATDLTSTATSGAAIASDPDPVADGSLVDVFAAGTNGDLLQFQRTAAGSWSSEDLTSLSGGSAIAGEPAAVVMSDGSFVVFAEGANQHLIEYSGAGSSWSSEDLTASAGAPADGYAPSAAINPSTGNLAVYDVTPAGHLVEVDRTPAPPATTTTTAPAPATSTGTSTVATPTPAPTAAKPTAGARPQLDVKVTSKWTWAPRSSRLIWLRLGRVSAKETLTLVCRGTGKRHRAGCPFTRRHATGTKPVAKLLAGLRRSRFGVGVTLDMRISRPGRKAERASFTIRRSKAPQVGR